MKNITVFYSFVKTEHKKVVLFICKNKMGGSLAQWIAHWALNREVESSNPPGGAGGPMDKTSGS